MSLRLYLPNTGYMSLDRYEPRDFARHSLDLLFGIYVCVLCRFLFWSLCLTLTVTAHGSLDVQRQMSQTVGDWTATAFVAQ